MIYKAKKGAAAAAAANAWTRFTPTGATRRDGDDATKPLDTSRANISDDGTSTTLTWSSGNTWSTSYKIPSKYACWMIDTGYNVEEVISVEVRIIMSALPGSDAPQLVWGFLVGNGTDPTSTGSWGGAQLAQCYKASNVQFGTKINYTTLGLTNSGSAAYTTLRGSVDINRISSSDVRVTSVRAVGFDPSGESIYGTQASHTNISGGNAASDGDPLCIGVFMGKFNSTDPTEDRSCVGKIWYSINDAGDKT